jgi:gp16 family phage-associated protein
MKLKTPNEVREDFTKNGVSIRSWAEANGFLRSDVYALLDGRTKGKYGNGHAIAVALGMKAGVTGVTPQNYRPVTAHAAQAQAVAA